MPKLVTERQREFLERIGQRQAPVLTPGCGLVTVKLFFDTYLKREEDDGKETEVRPRKVRRLLGF